MKLGTGGADERKCAYCGEDMPYAKYNQQVPSQPYVIWMLPGEDDHTPSAKKLYCTPGHLIKDIGLPFHFEPEESAGNS